MHQPDSRVTASSRSPVGSHSPMDDKPDRAHRACEKCTRTKKKCDKALPACSRCVRLAAECSYDYVFTAPTTTVVDSSTHITTSGSPRDHQLLAAASPRYNVFDVHLEIPSAMVMALLDPPGTPGTSYAIGGGGGGGRVIAWRESVDLFFQTTNLWLSAVHQERFFRKIDSLGPADHPREPEVALLIVCMHLVTQYADSGKPTMPDGTEMLNLPAYIVAKRILGLLRAQAKPCIELIQCAALLCLYEFGHGDFLKAYVTIGDAYISGKLLGIAPGKYVESHKDAPVVPEEEERRDLYWSLLIVDRLLRVERRLMWKPFHVPSPVEDDLLPITNIVWDSQAQAPVRRIQRHPASVAPTVVLGAFQRNCQCAILFTRAISWEAETYWAGRLPSVDSFAELDTSTRALIEAMLQQASTWGEYFECFATCTSLLLLLYCSYLCTIDAANVHNATTNAEVLKAIAGINFTIRIVADANADLNDHLARRPELLTNVSPITPFSAYHSLSALSNFEHIIPSSDTRFHDIYSSLHFFAKRWGVAGQLVKRIEQFLAHKDEEGSATLDFSFQSMRLH